MKKILLSLIFVVLLSANVLHAEVATMKTYYPNGKVQMETGESGMKTYYENGQLMSEISMKDGNPTGIGKNYYENGKIMREDNYEKGEWKQYNPDGTLLAEGKL